MAIYIVDIDGTICSRTEGDYENAVPYKNRIEKINKLYDEGHIIIYWTARGMSEYCEVVEKAYRGFFDFTKKQLDSWGAKYHEVKLGKPCYDHWIDDKAMNDKEYFGDLNDEKMGK